MNEAMNLEPFNMFINVDFPAPFSPNRDSISLSYSLILMSLLARTLGNCLVMLLVSRSVCAAGMGYLTNGLDLP